MSRILNVQSVLRELGAALIAAALLAVTSMVGTPALAQNTSCSATAAAFRSLQNGMSVAQVEAIIGCRGEVISESQFMDVHTVMLAWAGNGQLGASMNAMFQNNQMIMKAQYGLR